MEMNVEAASGPQRARLDELRDEQGMRGSSRRGRAGEESEPTSGAEQTLAGNPGWDPAFLSLVAVAQLGWLALLFYGLLTVVH